ncbi:MAG: hypothetical protein ACREJ0_16395 [Geminicoccaceae bacterium]
MRRERNAATAAAMVLLLAACSTVPVQHVEGYTEAFDQASVAGNRLYDGISAKVIQEQAIADAQAERVAATQATAGNTVIMPAAGPADNAVCPRDGSSNEPYPACFDPARFAPGRLAGEPDSLLVRRRALATITTFNAIALRLASGETAEELGAEVRRLGSNATSLATLSGAGAMVSPLIGLTSDLAAQLAGWAETLRADQELRAALDAGSPLIEQLLKALIDDTSTMYAFKREEVAAQADALTLEAGDIEFDVADIMTAHAAPQAAFVAELAQRDLRYNNARERIGLPFQSLAALVGRGGQPFTGQTLDQIDDRIARLEAIADQYQEQVATLNRYYEALGEYVAMLHEVNEALATATASARAPQAITISPAALSQQATEIRDQAREIQKLLDT